MYQPHPNPFLTELFVSKPYQGVAPEQAHFLFIGLDANYAANIEQSPIFPELLAYHEDGPTFWRKHGVHHPFLLPGYAGDGRRYHRTFSRIGFQPNHAHLVSFVELLHRPTVGRSQLIKEDLEAQHLKALRDAVFDGQAKYVFMSAGVLRLMQATGQFPQLAQTEPSPGELRTVFKDLYRTVFLHLHFSNYGKFESRLKAEAKHIAALLQNG